MCTISVHLFALTLLICHQSQPVQGGYGLGAPLCRGCRVRYVKQPQPILYMDSYIAPVRTMRQTGQRKIVRIINHYKQLNAAAASKLQARTANDYSFIVKLQLEGVSQCSAALISPRLLLSSSICLGNQHSGQLHKLRLQLLTRNGREFVTAAVHQPAAYKELVLLKLKQQLPPSLQAIVLCDEPAMAMNATMLMASADLSYYGRRSTQLVSNQACKATYEQYEQAFITPHMVCMANSADPDKCATVAGDALLCKGKLCGLNAYGSRCQMHANNTDLYINLCNINEFIKDVMQ